MDPSRPACHGKSPNLPWLALALLVNRRSREKIPRVRHINQGHGRAVGRDLKRESPAATTAAAQAGSTLTVSLQGKDGERLTGEGRIRALAVGLQGCGARTRGSQADRGQF